MPGMIERFPQLETVGIKRWFTALESFTEDTHFIMGEVPEVRGLYTATGFNGMGIAPVAGLAWRWRTGLPRDRHRTICGRSTYGASVRCTAPTEA
ncbi:MAG: hypothetical protein CM1200mP20_02650 [Pseudomonadota bacterium]|nr:MAG: hypothetical protein CM1200mP20_02650 [Pseudomonadota bacterium]